MNNFYSIHSFMYEELNLKGNDLNVFAVIYSFKEFKGSLSYLSKCIGVSSLTTVKKALNNLIEKELIVKEKTDNHFDTCTYICVYTPPTKIKKRYDPSKEWCGDLTSDPNTNYLSWGD